MTNLKPPYSRYAITDDGEVYSLIKREPFKMKTFNDKDGYLRVTLNTDAKKKMQVIVPRLMHEALIGPIPLGNVVRHIDGNNKNNHISNLTHGTVLENNRDKQRHGTQCRGETNGKSKLTEKQILYIRGHDKYWGYRVKLAKELGVTIHTIEKVVTNKPSKIWKHV